MKNNRFGFLMILAFAALASSCGTSGYYATGAYDDGIYYRPSADSRAKMVAAQEAQRERERQRQYDQYLAKDEEGNLYVVTELMDGETYESRLRKFDNPFYYSYAGYGYWDNPWYNPWWGSWRYGYSYWHNPWYDVSWYGTYPYFGYSYIHPYGWSWYDPWYWGVGGYAGWYGYHHWYRPYHYNPGHVGPGPGPGRNHRHNVVYTPRNSATGSGMYRHDRYGRRQPRHVHHPPHLQRRQREHPHLQRRGPQLRQQPSGPHGQQRKRQLHPLHRQLQQRRQL